LSESSTALPRLHGGEARDAARQRLDFWKITDDSQFANDSSDTREESGVRNADMIVIAISVLPIEMTQ
jgi:hypothetical protein